MGEGTRSLARLPPMSIAELLARFDRRARPLLVRLPPMLAIAAYSRGRRAFLGALEAPARAFAPPAELSVEAWGLTFRSPLGNAAGLFKQGEGAALAAAWGAGFWTVGTTTGRPRKGNRRHHVSQPFAPYPRSGAASNWLGLPNPGHRAVAARVAATPRTSGVVRIASLGLDPLPEVPEADRLAALIAGLEHYDEAGIDVVEINESCPNTAEDVAGMEHLERRLMVLERDFLARRRRRLPVLLKLSVDAEPSAVADVVALACRHGLDGLVLGNTSTKWQALRSAIDPAERPLYDRFVDRFGGGVSGRPLKAASLELIRCARQALATAAPRDEFHLVRVGGIESADDVRVSLQAGATLCQWYTGLFEGFAVHGHRFQDVVHQQLAQGGRGEDE